MTDASLLVGDDADLLIEELTAAAPGIVPEVRSFALGSDSARPPEKLTGLERMGEKVARALRVAVEPLVNARTKVTPEALAVRRFDDWSAKLPFFLSLSHYWLRPLKGGMLIAIPPEFIGGLMERFYGGSAAATSAARRHGFSASGELLLGRLLEKIVAILGEHWREVAPVEAVLAARETSMSHMAFCRPDDAVVVQSFAIEPADGAPATISIVYPLAMLRPIEERMATRIHDDNSSDGDDWRRQLAHALEQVTLPVRSVLARPEITLQQLMQMQPGDVIPIQLAPRTPLLVAQRPIAEGTIGEQDGRAALLIERIGTPQK